MAIDMPPEPSKQQTYCQRNVRPRESVTPKSCACVNFASTCDQAIVRDHRREFRSRPIAKVHLAPQEAGGGNVGLVGDSGHGTIRSPKGATQN
ncbi:hypothetical protein TUM20983_26430 [Mycobacterium antarcticum]|nr:hypothetical protein TUM20983_26430 [Mycolicibacterium sp. TUM20983]